jgi:hypothetical protein
MNLKAEGRSNPQLKQQPFMNLSFIDCCILHAVVEIVDSRVRITSPDTVMKHISDRLDCDTEAKLVADLREWNGLATATKNSKRQNEHHDLGSAIQSRRNNIIVLDEEYWVTFSEPPLCNETEQEIHEDSGVDADEEIAHVPTDDGQIDVSPKNMGSISVNDPEWEGDGKTNEVGKGDPFVSCAY